MREAFVGHRVLHARGSKNGQSHGDGCRKRNTVVQALRRRFETDAHYIAARLEVIDQMTGKESEAAGLLAASGGPDMSLRHNRPGSTTQYGG